MRVGIQIPALNTQDEEIPKEVEVIKAPEAWAYTRGAGTRIAILSTGIFTPHEDLAVIEQLSFVTGDPDPQDRIGAGTNCAGVAAVQRNSKGIIGVAPEATLISAKVLAQGGVGTISDVCRAFDWCASIKPDVVMLPFGGAGPCTPEVEEKLLALAEGGSVVLSVHRGTNGGQPTFPGCCTSLISVGTPPNEWHSDDADVFSWAGRMKTTALGGGWEYWSSSYSSLAIVAGAAALIKSMKPIISLDEMRELLRTTSDDAGSTTFPYRQVNVSAALRKLAGGK